LFIHLALHHPKNADQKSRMMAMMTSFAEVQKQQKGFIDLVVGEVQDENIIFLTGMWETEQDFRSALPAIGGFLGKIDFPSLQDGPTRAGYQTISTDSPLTTIKVGSVSGPRL
jgi:putative SOS response-associated peptidase YedK